jgi:peptide deformylase
MRIVAKGWNMHGEPVTVEGSELLARAIQHETDHINGIVFIDRLDEQTRKLAMKDIRDSEWFSDALTKGTAPIIKVSPHNTFGKGF